jgi:hypothetical protein
MESNHRWAYSPISQVVPSAIHTQPFREVLLTRKNFFPLLGLVPKPTGVSLIVEIAY